MADIVSPDRTGFFDRLTDINARAETSGATSAMLLVDVRNLPRINSQAGFEAGDQTLANCFSALQEISSLEDAVFRVGDKRFALLLPPLKSPAFVGLALNKVVAGLQREGLVPRDNLVPDIKIGIAIGGKNGGTAQEMLLRAEDNLAQAKKQRAAFVLDAVSENEAERQQLVRDFEEALRSNAFSLYYQPKAELRSGRVVSAEGLLRWEHPQRGFVSPDIVVDIATRTGGLLELTKWSLHTALRQLATLVEEKLDVRLAVNVPASLVSSGELGNIVQDALAIWSVNPERLILEITESAVIEDIAEGSDYLHRIRDLGVGLSIDDFGTGYSTLSYFKEIPAQELKIDRRFIENLLYDRQDQEIVRIIIDIARVFGFCVVAEGIEDRETLDYLKRMGCDMGQGYYIARPTPMEELISWLRDIRAA